MNIKFIPILLALALIYAPISFGAEEKAIELIPLSGISLNMKKNKLLDNWGFPAKRDHKIHADVWFYPNVQTPNPTDGVVVSFKKGRVSDWKLVDNMYSEMEVWGKAAGSYR
jgi:hypothetical protein